MCIRDSQDIGNILVDLHGQHNHQSLLDPSKHIAVSYTHLRAHETPEHLVCRLLLEKKKKITTIDNNKILVILFFFFIMIRRPPRSTRVRSSAASDVYKRQQHNHQSLLDPSKHI